MGLISRETAIAKIVGTLEERRLVTVTGAGGLGNTRVALAVGDVFVGDSEAI